jgi:hypothetical protein
VPDAPGELVGRWRIAEQRLYPIVLADPLSYERYVLAVRRLADELSAVTSPEALIQAFGEAAPRAAEHLRTVGAPDDPGSVDLVAGAAFALRERQLAAAQAAAERRRRLADAARSGAAWVVVQRQGELAMASFGNYRCLEMHLPDGAGLYAFAEPQAEAVQPIYVVERLQLDPASGAALGEVEQRWTFEDAASWVAALDELRDVLDRTG